MIEHAATSTDTARDYLRVSRDASGQFRSTRDQHADNGAFLAEHGITLRDDSYDEADASASEYGTKARDDWQRVLADIRDGSFGAPVLSLWESSRGSRQVEEWVELIKVCRHAGLRIAITADERIYNPANGSDRKALIDNASDAEHESYKTSRRIRRTAAQAAQRGEPWGPTPFGYARLYKVLPSGKRVIDKQVPHPDESQTIKKLYERLNAGDTLAAIARDFAEKGITGRTGKPLRAETLRNMALRPTYAGLRMHAPDHSSGEPGRIKSDSLALKTPLDSAVEAIWPPLVDPEVYYEVRAVLTGRMHGRGGKQVHLLGMIGTCGNCGSHLGVRRSKNSTSYRCQARGCAILAKTTLDGHVLEIVWAWLGWPENFDRLRADGQAGPELQQVRAELARVNDRIKKIKSKAERDDLDDDELDLLLRQLRGRTAKRDELKAREEELSTPAPLAWLLKDLPADQRGRLGEMKRRWETASMPAKRQVMRELLVPGVIGRVALYPGRGVPVAERVKFLHDV